MFEPGRVRPGSRPGLSSSLSSASSTPRGRPTTPSAPLTISDGAASQLAMLDDASYFSVMRQDILQVQQRLRAFATPRRGTEVSEASLQLIGGGSNVLQAKVTLHELLAEKMLQLEKVLVQATAEGADGVGAGTGGASRLSYYLVALDRLQRLHAQALDGHAAPTAPVTNGPGGGQQADELLARLHERERLNATLERELMELQSTLRVHEADAQRRIDEARAEGAAVGSQAPRAGESAQHEEEAQWRQAAARSADELAQAQRDAAGLRTQVEQLSATLVELQARSSPEVDAKRVAREEELAATAAQLEAALQQRDATIAGLKRALSELEAQATAQPSAATVAEATAKLEAELAAERSAARNSANYLQARIDQLSAQLDITSNGEEDKSMLKHMHAENERLQARALLPSCASQCSPCSRTASSLTIPSVSCSLSAPFLALRSRVLATRPRRRTCRTCATCLPRSSASSSWCNGQQATATALAR